MTEEIKQTEKGALEFAQKVYGEDLADAMYLGTYGGISYFGFVFYEKDATRPSFLITYSEREYHFLPSEKFALDSVPFLLVPVRVILINVGHSCLFLGNLNNVVTCFSHKCTLFGCKYNHKIAKTIKKKADMLIFTNI